MKKSFSLFLLLLIFSMVLTSCSIPTAVCQHRDADDNEKCDECGQDYTDGKDLECAHDFGDWAIYGDNADTPCDQKPLYRICSACSDIEWKDGSYENHSFKTVTFAPTCQAEGYDEKTCTVCGLVEKVNTQPIGDHDYNTTYESNNSFHWLDCKNCDAKDAYAEHTADESGFCITCNAQLAPTEGVIYDVSADGTYAEVIGFTGSATKVMIAETYEGLPVKSIYKEGFKNNDTITQVVIPDSVETIGSSAFKDCNSLVSVKIGNSVTAIGHHAFKDCDSLTSVTIPNSVISIGYEAFAYCDSLDNATFGNSITWIGDSAFYNCDSLDGVVIPNSVESIGSYAFADCSLLTNVTISGTPTIDSGVFAECNPTLYMEYGYGTYVKANDNPYAILHTLSNENLSTYEIHEDTKFIAGSVFRSCERLTSITIPNGVQSIGDGAFYNCCLLTSVTIPDSVISIGYDAFVWCESLNSVIIPNSVTSIGFSAFYYCDSLESVYYKGDAAEWNAISIDNNYGYNNTLLNATRYYYSEEAPTEAGNYWHYDADGKVAVW